MVTNTIHSGAKCPLAGLHAKRCSAGMTLVEMLLALALSAIIGSATAMMLTSVNSATNVQHDVRRAIIQRQTAITRLGALTRGAAMVLSHGEKHLVLWLGDGNENGVPDLSELRRIEWDDDEHEIVSFAAPSNLDPGSNTTYALTDDFAGITQSLANSNLFPARVSLRNVTEWNAALNSTDAKSASAVYLQATINHKSGDDRAVVISTLRANRP